VSTIYVTSSVQKSYEGRSHVVDPRDWIRDGMGPLPKSSIVYGVSDVKVQQIDDDVFRAVITSWSSENYLDERNTLIEEDGMDVYRYTEVVDFTFRTRGTWREISNIEKVDMTLDQVYHVDYL
ncbi:MAG: hypothetical protein IIU49_03965, partial [Spirochaetales bacterium]|nr:hypothetical protein [Spirochaetales bacterium]